MRFVQKCGLFALFLIVLIAPAPAQETKLGEIDFPTSGSDAAQKHFLEGVLWLHSFEYDKALEAFVSARTIDPGFAVAYWGEAMTYNHPIWMERDAAGARTALERLAKTPEERLKKAPTEREKGYLRAVEILYAEGEKKSRDDAYADSMRRLAEQYPNDMEAASFYALALLGTCQYERNIPTYMKAAAIAEEVFSKNPLHPGAAHYLIHSYDDPVHAPLGLRAAKAYSRIAPAAPHALHMPSHIFLALGMWDDVVTSNTSSWKASNAKNYHALHWLEYGYLQQGRYQDARKLLSIMQKDNEKDGGSDRTRYFFGGMRAAYIIEARAWQGDVLDLKVSTDGTSIAVSTGQLFVGGFAAIQRGDLESAKKVLTDLEELTSSQQSKETGHAHNIYSCNSPSDIKAAAVMKKQLRGMILFHEGDKENGLKLLQETTGEEDAMSFEFGPPLIIKPSHELYGEMLQQVKRHAEAQKQFEVALARAPKRSLSLLGLARSAQAAGDQTAAAQAMSELRKIWLKADPNVTATLAGTAGR